MNRSENHSEKLPVVAHIVAGWPLAMVVFGGGLGGLCGGLSYGLSMMIITKRGWSAGSGLLAVLIGIIAVGTYFAVVIVLAILFPDLFQES